MDKRENKIVNISENDVMNMLKDTSQLMANDKIDKLTSAVIAAQNSNALSGNVEFWQWMGRNYEKSGIFETNASMQEYIAKGITKEEWLIKQLQGKGYEWDWITNQRSDIHNIFNTYDAGDVANRVASDVTKHNILTCNNTEYQMKAYTSKNNPNLKNTPKDMAVVTNSEKVDIVNRNGYKNVDEFQNNQQIKQATNDRLNQIKDNKVYTNYNFTNVAGVMIKAGLVGCAIGVTVETISSYKAWKQGRLSKSEYLKEIFKAGGDAGFTSGITAGIMVPISATITAAGVSTLITIPIAFVIGGAVKKVVAPCFGRGDYKKILSEAKYYQNLENIYDDLISTMQYTSQQYYYFIDEISRQNTIYKSLKEINKNLDKELKDLYDST